MKIDFTNLIQGFYEAERLFGYFSSERSVPDFAFNVLNQLGLLYRPVVNENYLNRDGVRPIWPNGKKFAVCLTHDVDRVSLFSLKQHLRNALKHFVYKDSFVDKMKGPAALGVNMTKMLTNPNKRDPLHCYEHWLEIEQRYNSHSTFFFWSGLQAVKKRHWSDCVYELSDSIVFDNQKCSVAEMIREIDRRGWEVGLHPSWFSYNDVKELKRQKDALEETLGHEVVSLRQHHLHYDIRVTPRVHSDAGFKYDSSLGFNDNIGFRFGTCYPWHLYDLKHEKQLPIIEIPLIIQDSAMLNPNKGMRLNVDMAFQYVMQLAEAVENVGGVLTLLWHPYHIIQEPYRDLFLKTLDYLKQRNAWFASVKEIGMHWESQYQHQN